ncbi:MAG: hypothetical protein ACXWBS_04795, partial [Chthoniobacterales bacterium]
MRFAAVCTLLLIVTARAQSSPEQTFIEAYKRAHLKRDVAAIKKLMYLDRVAADDPQLSDPRAYNLDEAIESLHITPTRTWPLASSCCDPSEIYVRDGVQYEFNLPIAASLHIDYVPAKDRGQMRIDVPL